MENIFDSVIITGMEKFALVIAPSLWPGLPLPGAGYLMENLGLHHIETVLFDLNIQYYNLLKKDKGTRAWTRDHYYFSETFFNRILADHPGPVREMIREIKNRRIDSIGFSVYRTNLLFSLSLAFLLKQELPGIRIIFGGPDTAFLKYSNPDYFNTPLVDHYVIGEGERTLPGLLSSGNAPKTIVSDQIKDLDTLPFPRYSRFTLDSYSRPDSLALLFSRGCVNHCEFCFEKLLYPCYYTHSPEYMMDQINFHVREHKIRWFTFYDSLFNGHTEKLARFLELMVRHSLPITWDAQVSISQKMEKDLLTLMKKSGCNNLFIGLESASPRVLKRMKKNFGQAEAENLIRELHEQKISFELSLILNYIDETDEELEQTLQFLKRNKMYITKIAQVNPYLHYPGTGTDISRGYDLITGFSKVKKVMRVLEQEKIRFTKSYINNLAV
ncbi:MAG: radical SAM protein [bacterium]|nr:radical SAM protein [bacterium]